MKRGKTAQSERSECGFSELWSPPSMHTSVDLDGYLAECRQWVRDEIRAMIPKGTRAGPVLYDLMLEYPLRPAKGLRPALCIAVCRALGGSLEAVLPSAAVLELYHNAFLIHDDVEDGSEKRRDLATLHLEHGVPIAVNVGDGMLALCLGPLLDNMRVLDMGRALRVLQTIARMARESAEGQALELDWVRHARWDLTDEDYLGMVDQKTGWYSFVAPVVIGSIAAGAPRERTDALAEFAHILGGGFQIQDDVLNLVARGDGYGKELGGDLWEGKHTLMLLHALRAMSRPDRERALGVLAKPRPALAGAEGAIAAVRALLPTLVVEGCLREDGRRALEAALGSAGRGPVGVKTSDEVEWLFDRVRSLGSIEYAQGVARERASRAGELLATFDWLRKSVHSDVLQALVDYVVERDR